MYHMLTRPDDLPRSHTVNIMGLIETIQLPYMSDKDMHLFAATQAKEIKTTIDGWDVCGRIIARAAERMMLGLPMSCIEELLEASRLYANSALLGGAAGSTTSQLFMAN
ncbi:hypothetical protein J7T55_000142 [Diaporthe amygdali]|uniref:uncharacterized protein n=1 Tax=Phomopsis amygdali TaxID=1214568 RepID=UPI0022FEBAE9|nr:uncharacterized protein J7T55_000142 [Diaporthe amygdali]KAJ0108177.1 hypothetical protein J7T55_000142 [Diaporthe amygdali]